MTAEMSKASQLLHGGRIHTLDPAHPEVEAIAIGGGRILALGALPDVMQWSGRGTRMIDLQGRMVMPGLIDFHIHLFSGAIGRLFELRLPPGCPFAAILDLVGSAAAKPDARPWIIAGPFSRVAEAGMRDLTALRQLDGVSNGHPVVLTHLSGHARFANSRALELAGIGAATPDPPHGEIVRDARTGQPTGYLLEAASTLVRQAIPALTADEEVAAARHGVALLNRFGITGFLDAMASPEMMRAFKTLDDASGLDAWAGFCLPAVANIVGSAWPDPLIDRRADLCGRHMRADFGKIFLDGVPSLRTAAMIDPYAPAGAGEAAPERGETLLCLDELTAGIAAFDRRGMSVKVHAIGDRAIQMMLDAVERVRRLSGTRGTAHQLSHGNYIRAEDIARLSRLNVIADLNPPLWFPSATNLVHERAVGPARFARAWPIRDIVRSGALAATGTDWPAVAEEPDPWVSLSGIVTRRDASGRHPGACGPDQALDLKAALPLYTRNPARAMGLGAETGMLAPGHSADLVVLDRDLFAIPGEEIAATRVLATLFEGRVVHGEI
ncbi:amidohydrolase [Phreatobacter stygius]|uniref:Amidohydrolase n=1 Tax=Phreatobacter stygius TaxID=1940610 RepID=A0A4D7AR29_9HYPH|nr:amidohydrolase [Phreatobacter stygius]QCI63409.1 amidohydrolase [Phreatobacter stygius]